MLRRVGFEHTNLSCDVPTVRFTVFWLVVGA